MSEGKEEPEGLFSVFSKTAKVAQKLVNLVKDTGGEDSALKDLGDELRQDRKEISVDTGKKDREYTESLKRPAQDSKNKPKQW